MRTRLAVILLLWLCRIAAAAPGRLDIVTYDAPDGWKVEPAEGRVTLTYISGGKYLMFGIYRGQPASGDLSADFRREWTAVVASQFKPATTPAPSVTTIGNGLTAAVGVAPATSGEMNLVAMLLVLDGGNKVASVLVLVPDADALKASQGRIAQFVAALQIARSGGAPAAPAPAGGGGGKTITVADLAGEWNTSAVAGSGNHYSAANAVYRVSPDGSYTYSSRGILNGGNSAVNYSETGTFSIDGKGLIVVTPKGKQPTRYRFIDWKEGPDGTILTLLDADTRDEPASMMYAVHWGRKKR